jgi:hypothetical protein
LKGFTRLFYIQAKTWVTNTNLFITDDRHRRKVAYAYLQSLLPAQAPVSEAVCKSIFNKCMDIVMLKTVGEAFNV